MVQVLLCLDHLFKQILLKKTLFAKLYKNKKKDTKGFAWFTFVSYISGLVNGYSDELKEVGGYIQLLPDGVYYLWAVILNVHLQPTSVSNLPSGQHMYLTKANTTKQGHSKNSSNTSFQYI